MEDADVPTSRVVAFDMAVNVVPFVDSLAIPGFPTLLTLEGPDRNHLVEVTRIRSRNPHRPAPPSEPRNYPNLSGVPKTNHDQIRRLVALLSPYDTGGQVQLHQESSASRRSPNFSSAARQST